MRAHIAQGAIETTLGDPLAVSGSPPEQFLFTHWMLSIIHTRGMA